MTTFIDENGNKLTLHQAVEDGNLNLVKEMIEQGYDVNEPDEYEQTPLHIAAGHPNGRSLNMALIVRELIKGGAELNLKDDRGATPLHSAVDFANMTGYLDIVKELLEAKADPNIRMDAGNTPLRLVNERNTSHTAQVAELLEKFGGQM